MQRAGTNRMYIYRTHTYVCIAAGVAETRETPLGMLRLQGVRGGPAEPWHRAWTMVAGSLGKCSRLSRGCNEGSLFVRNRRVKWQAENANVRF